MATRQRFESNSADRGGPFPGRGGLARAIWVRAGRDVAGKGHLPGVEVLSHALGREGFEEGRILASEAQFSLQAARNALRSTHSTAQKLFSENRDFRGLFLWSNPLSRHEPFRAHPRQHSTHRVGMPRGKRGGTYPCQG